MKDAEKASLDQNVRNIYAEIQSTCPFTKKEAGTILIFDETMKIIDGTNLDLRACAARKMENLQVAHSE